MLASLGVFGALVLILSTRWGAGLSPDSVLYIASARNLLQGKGLSISFDPEQFAPMTQYPPLYPALLAGVGYFGVDPAAGARWLNALLLALNIAIAGYLTHLAVRSFRPAVFAALFMMTAPPVAQVHSMAWSEPLFLAFGLLALAFLISYLERPRIYALVAASLAVALAFLVRYAGAALVAAGLAAILALNKTGWKRSLRDAAVFALVSCLPITVWLIRNFFAAGAPTNRTVSLHPPTAMHLRDALDAVSSWFFPAIAPAPLRSLALLVLVAVSGSIYLMTRQRLARAPTDWSRRLTKMCLLFSSFVACYGLVIFLSVSFFDAYIPMDSRILSPLYPAVLVLGMIAWARFVAVKEPSFRVRLTMAVLAAVVFCSQSAGAGSWLYFSYRDGIGYAGREWQESQLIKRVRGLDQSVPIFTNAPEVVYVLAGRPAYGIPAKVNPQTQLPNEGYRSELVNLLGRLQAERGVLVYFRTVSWRWYLPSERDLSEDLGLHLIAKEEDGAIYQAGDGGRIRINDS